MNDAILRTRHARARTGTSLTPCHIDCPVLRITCGGLYLSHSTYIRTQLVIHSEARAAFREIAHKAPVLESAALPQPVPLRAVFVASGTLLDECELSSAGGHETPRTKTPRLHSNAMKSRHPDSSFLHTRASNGVVQLVDIGDTKTAHEIAGSSIKVGRRKELQLQAAANQDHPARVAKR